MRLTIRETLGKLGDRAQSYLDGRGTPRAVWISLAVGPLQQVADEDGVAEPPRLGEDHRVGRPMGKGGGRHEARGPSVADEEWRDHQVQLVRQALGEELRVD